MTQTPIAELHRRHPEVRQVAVAAEVDISESHYSLIVSGDRRPSLPVGRKIVAALVKLTGEPVTLDDLFGAEPESEQKAS